MMPLEPVADRAPVTATANPALGEIHASALFDTSPERLFRALASEEICDWWVRPGVFNTQTWSGQLREGGRWTAAGIGGGQPYQLEGEYISIDEARRLVHTWRPVGTPGEPSMLTYDLERTATGVRLTLSHTGLMNPDVCERTRAGWETSLARLKDIVSKEQG